MSSNNMWMLHEVGDDGDITLVSRTHEYVITVFPSGPMAVTWFDSSDENIELGFVSITDPTRFFKDLADIVTEVRQQQPALAKIIQFPRQTDD